ncbi:MAG: response regulator [Rhodospirillales bacterium]|jgi:YesN/AraC family two-component response regulator
MNAAIFEVFDAENGDIAVRLLQQHSPNVVLTDLVMDGGEGINSIIKIRKINPTFHIIAMSGNPKYLKISCNLGTDSMLLKPFWMPQLIDVIEQGCR